jgi:hypothetical protein
MSLRRRWEGRGARRAMNPDASSCAEESATAKRNSWRQTKLSFLGNENFLIRAWWNFLKKVESGSEVCIPVWVSGRFLGLTIMVLKNKIPGSDIYQQSFFGKKSNNHLENFWLFHETWRFCEGIEITGIRGSLILIVFSTTWNQWSYKN